MKNMIKTVGSILALLVLFSSFTQAETLWEKRRRAFDRLNKNTKESATNVKKSGKYTSIVYKSSKDNFGIKELTKFSSTKQFRNPYNVTIPVEFGEVREVLLNKGKPLIINIQDYHCNYQAQKQIAFILEELVVNAGMKLIMVEGNSKDASLKHLRSMATRERRIEVAEDYLKRGMISGEEYLDIICEYDFKPLGIEDKELYMKNLDSFLEIDKFQKDALAIIDSFKLVIQNLKVKIYNKKVYTLDRKRQECDEEKISFETYSQYLLNLAKDKNVSIDFPHDNIKRVLQAVNKEKEISFQQVNRERDAFISRISKKLSDEELARLLFKAKEFKAKRISANDFHNYIEQLPHGDWKKDYPEFVKYIEYLNLHASIEVLALFNELNKLEDIITDALFKKSDERILWKHARNIDILYGFYALELIPDQYDYFKTHPEEFRIPEWQASLDRMVRKSKLSKTVPQDVSLIVDKMDTTDNFYQLAKQRDYVFVKKIKGYMQQEKADIAVLITGGFHSTNLASLIHDAGYSFMTVLPVVTEVTDEELYHSVLRYKSDLMRKAENKQ